MPTVIQYDTVQNVGFSFLDISAEIRRNSTNREGGKREPIRVSPTFLCVYGLRLAFSDQSGHLEFSTNPGRFSRVCGATAGARKRRAFLRPRSAGGGGHKYEDTRRTILLYQEQQPSSGSWPARWKRPFLNTTITIERNVG